MWNITLKVSRQKQGETPHFDEYKMEANPDEHVMDMSSASGLSRIERFVFVTPVIIPPAVRAED